MTCLPLTAATPPTSVTEGLANSLEVLGRGRVTVQELVEASCQLLSNPAQFLAEPSPWWGAVSTLPPDMLSDPAAGGHGPGVCGPSREMGETSLPRCSGSALPSSPAAARLATASACSFPSTPAWAGVHRAVTLLSR